MTSARASAMAGWAVLGYLVLVPWTGSFIAPWLSGHDYARIVQAILCAICAAAAAWPLLQALQAPAPTATGPSQRQRGLVAAIAGLALGSAVLAPVPLRALQELTLAAGSIAIAIVIAAQDRDTALRRFGQGAIAALFFYNALALVVMMAALANGLPASVDSLALGYDNRRFFNHVQTVALPLVAAALHLRPPGRLWMLAGWAALVSGFALLVLSGGRGTFIGVMAATLASGLWVGRQEVWRCVRPLVLSMLAGWLLYLLLFVALPQLLGQQDSVRLVQRALDTSDARLYLWDLSLGYIAQSPWLGIGPMHYAHYPNLKAAHPHNVYLQVAAEWGLPLFLLVMTWAVGWLWRAARAVREAGDPVQRCVGGCLLVACAAAAVDGVVSGNFVMPVSQVWIAVAAGLTAGWLRGEVDERGEMGEMGSGAGALPRGAVARAWTAGAAALLAASALVQPLLMIRDLQSFRDLERAAQAASVNRSNPRYWIEGWFTGR